MANSIWITPGAINNSGSALTFPLGTVLQETALGTLAMVSASAANQIQVPNGSNLEYVTIGWSSNTSVVGGVKNGGTARNGSFAAGSSVLFAPNNGIVAYTINTSGVMLSGASAGVWFGPAGVVSLTVVNGIVTAAS